MKNNTILFLLIFLMTILTVSSLQAQKKTFDMDNEKMGKILEEEGDVLAESVEGYWQVVYHQRPILVITDQDHNRMRIISPIIKQNEMALQQYEEVLLAQFDRALDVKYALYDEILWSVFAHPLQELTEEQFKDALSQVFYAAENFGTSYTSTDIIFGGEGEEE